MSPGLLPAATGAVPAFLSHPFPGFALALPQGVDFCVWEKEWSWNGRAWM